MLKVSANIKQTFGFSLFFMVLFTK